MMKLINHENIHFDYIIIGGGMGGMYAAEKLYEKYGSSKKIALFDDRTYFGGRLLTHQNPHYEIGGARFHDNHILLNKLIDKYNMEKYKLSNKVDFIYKRGDKIKFFKDAATTFRQIMNNIIKLSNKVLKKDLQSMTLKQFIDKVSNGFALSKRLIHIFGYYSEICEMNAYDSLSSMKNDFLSNDFYILKKGFSKLFHKMYNKNKGNIYYNLNCSVKNVKRINGHFLCEIENVKYNNKFEIHGNNVIFALKAKQLKPFDVLKNIKSHLNDVYSAPLLRIYAKYPPSKNGKVWFHDMNRITTNSILRQIIPINEKEGLIMISYTDGEDINPFYENKRQKKLKNDKEILSLIKNELDILYPQCNIPQPTYFKCHLWHVGAHHWRPNVNSDFVSKKILNPSKNVYVIGEAFSQKQAWVEGALETVEKIIYKL